MSTLTASHRQMGRQPGPRRKARPLASELARYSDDRCGAIREIVCLPGADGTRLVVDRLADTHADARLVAHLAVDEPPENARIVTEVYLADESKGQCRLLKAEDLQSPPAAERPAKGEGDAQTETPLVDSAGIRYSIREISRDRSFPELRWTRSCHPGQEEPFTVLTLRDVIARVENYEPARAITSAVLDVHRDDRSVSTCRLQGELERVSTSEIVLNRGLRNAVHRKLARGDLTMSEIAMRCGRIKRDERGNQSGETSWLARRIGKLREGGQPGPSPWIHTDVLALIARDGLGTSPREVEL
jgi:hypothetical protein